MFGSQNKPFGTATPFGASANTSGFGSTGFGSQPGASTSLFGGTNTSTQSGSIFGGSGTFGQTSQSSGFSFGGAATPQTAGGGGLFGSNTTQQSIFGTPTTNNAFGAKTPANFGSSNVGGSLFAQPASSSSLFGTSTTSSTSLFGGGTANKGFGQASSGTTVKFNPPTGQDTMMKGGISTNINTRHQCITAMKDYESKSLEELRTEDYLANRKGPQAGGTSTGLFGGGTTNPQTTQSSFSFGSNKSSGFGGGTSLFGQPQQQQQQSTGLFGTGNQSGSSLFGTTTTTSTPTSGFGGFGTNTSGTSLFGGGNTQAKSLFGSTATTQSSGTGLFGSTQTSTSGFGGFGGFGQQNQQNQQGGLFKSATGGFGTASTGTTGFGFGGNTNTTGGGGLFGNKTATSGTGFTFGQQSSAPGFGTTQTNSLFGNKGTTGFGTSNNQLGGGTSGLFGGLGGGINTGGSLFLNQQNKTGFNMGSTFGGTGSTFGNPGTNTLGGSLGQATTNGNNQQAAEMAALQQQLNLLSNNPYGDSALFRNIPSRSEKREDILKPTNPAAQRAALNSSASQYKVSPRPAPKIKVKPLQSLMNTKSQLFDGLEDDDSSFGNDTFTPRRSIKKLVIGKQSPNSSVLSQSQTAADEDLVAPSTGYPRDSPVASKQQTSTAEDVDNLENDIIKGNKAMPDSLMQSPMRPSPDDTINDLNSASGNRASSSRSPSQLRISEHVADHNEEESVIQDHPAGIILTRSEYFTIPTLEELAEMVDENGDCYVENFTVGRELYGNVFFPGITNVSNMNLDEIVHFRRKEVTLYPDDSEKPPVGEGLNKVAQVTLDCVWPNDKSNHSPIKSPERLVKIGYQNKLEQATAKMGAKFIDYRPDTGSWVFEVKHFSKYGLIDDDEDEPVETEAKKIKQQLKDESLQQHKVQKKPVILEKEPPQLQRPLTDRWSQQDLSQSEMSPSEMLQQQQHRPDQVMEDGGAAAAPCEDDHGMIQQMTMPDEAGAMAAFEEDFGEMEPSSHRLAQHFGINAHSVQVMKASFFGEEENYGIESQSSQLQQPSSYIDLRDQQLDSSEMGRSLFAGGEERQDRSLHTSMSMSYQQEPEADRSIFGSATSRHPTLRLPLQSMPDQLRYPSISVHPQPPRSKVVGACIQRRVTPLSESIMCGQQRSLLDSGLFMGRRFRVGWGPNWSLSHSGEPVLKKPSTEEVEMRHTSLLHGISAQQALDKSPYQVSLEKVDGKMFVEDTDSSLQAMTEGLLQIALDNSYSTEEDGCPLFVPKPGVDALHKYAELSQEQLQKIGDLPDDNPVHHADAVWSLATALWGRLEGSQSQDDNELSYHSVMSRREALSRWLTSTSQSTVNKEVEQAKFQGDDHIPAVFSLLTGRHVAEACTLAQQSGDHRLALLMSQAAGSGCGRQQLSHQLNSWGSRKTDQFIAAERLKIFSLLSGSMVWRGSKQEINVCQDLDWKRCLALHLWYHCPPSATIPDALAAYDKAFRDDGYAAPPLPPYLEKNSALCEEMHNEFKKYDMCYHLLKLYSERSYRMEHTLAPSASTPNPLDAKLSWHLGQVLQALAYSHLSEHHDASLCSSYAAQLEGLGLWHWAVFVMLHIKDPARRRSCIQELLYRHVSLCEDDEQTPEEEFLTDKLNIPAAWIHQAKAVLAHHRGDHAKEAYHLLHAGRWSQCHHVLIRHLAADAFIEEEFSYLNDFLSEMSPHAAGIQDWETGGKIYHDFIQLQRQLEQIQEGQISGYEVERLQTQVHSLSRRMGRLQCFTAKHRLCQAELCKRLSVLIRTLYSIQDPDSRQALASLLAPVKLPMPEDYALQELRNITMDFMNELPVKS